MSRFFFLLPLLLLGILTPFSGALDFWIAKQCYSNGHFFENPVTRFLFLYGERFGFAVGALSCLFACFSKKWRKGAIVMLLTLVIGAGILINGVFKEVWGRPRPRQVVEFGGQLAFRPYYKPAFFAEKQKSFPSGHTAMGFYYIALVLVGVRYRNRVLLVVGVVLTVTLGLGLMVCRIVQGGHFFSDTYVSFVIMWYSAFLADYICRLNTKKFTKADLV